MQFVHSMSMVLFLVPYFLLPLLIRAGPLSTASSTASLPPSLAVIVPPCAQSCVKSSITQNFPTCQQQQDFSCLCINSAVSGLTLGEQSLSCLASACPSDVFYADAVAVYKVCEGVQNSSPMTHTVLTATQSTIKTISGSVHIPTSAPNDTSSTVSSNSIESCSTYPPSITTTAIVTATSKSSSTSSSSSSSVLSVSPIIPKSTTFTSTSASTPSLPSSTHATTSSSTSSATPAAGPVLTKPQIAGVTVAVVGVAAISFGILFFILCRRRRRNSKRRNSGSSFGGDKIIESQQGSRRTSAVMARNPENGDRPRNLPTNIVSHTLADSAANNESRWTLWPKAADEEEIGVVVDHGRGSQAVDDNFPVSAASRRTNSQLLPDKPTYSLYPSPLRIKTQMSPISPIAGNTDSRQRPAMPPARPSPRGRNSSDTSQATLQRGRFNEQLSPTDPFVDPHTGSHPSTHTNHQSQVPPVRLPYPSALNYGPWTRSAETIRKPVPARESLSAPRSQPLLNRSHPGFENGNSTGDPRSQGLALSDLLPSSETRSQRSFPQRKSSRRPATYFSMNSDTSFEDAEDDDEMPRQHHRLLSTADRSYHGQVRYPRIPSSVAPLTNHQPSLGSPKRPQRPRVQVELNPARDKSFSKAPASRDNPASLLAKRRGTGRASELAQELRDREIGEDELHQTAKWKILVSPGLDGIKDEGPPTTFGSPRTGRSMERASPTSRKRGN